jgi:hypothetical protein
MGERRLHEHARPAETGSPRRDELHGGNRSVSPPGIRDPDAARLVGWPWDHSFRAWADWPGKGPYGLPFFRDDVGEIRPGIVVMPAGGGDFWIEIAQDLRDASPRGYAKLLATYADGRGGLDLQPFFDLIGVHELGHAFEVLGDLRLPTLWLSEIFVNLAMHAFVATQLPATVDGENGLVRFWNCFHASDRVDTGVATAASLAPLLTTEVSETLGRAVRDWR